MSDFGVVDTHVHVWDTDLLPYPWLESEPELNRPHLLGDYAEATLGIPIERMIFVQCEVEPSRFLDEAAWVAEQTELDPRLEGIVPWAPLEWGDDARDALATLTRDPRVKGVRRIIQFEDDPAFCLRPGFVRGVQLLAEFGLHFELCLKGDEQFGHAIELVRQCPEVRFMLDHIGKPWIRERRLSPWDAHIRELAALPNTWCKLSGLVNEADHETWTGADLRPYIDHVLASFGFGRCCFGGDWPVCTLAGGYREWAGALAKAVAGCSETEMRQLFHDTAVSFYRLDP